MNMQFQIQHSLLKPILPDFRNIDRCAFIQRLSNFLPTSVCELVSFDELPKISQEYFENRSAMLISPEDYIPASFDWCGVIYSSDGLESYFAHQVKNLSHTAEEDAFESSLYVCDLRKGSKVGDAVAIFRFLDERKYFKDKPTVSWNGTEELSQNQGLGTRRLCTLNALTRTTYGFPVNSSTHFLSNEENLWKFLVTQNFAKKYSHRSVLFEGMPYEEEGTELKNRYVFLE